MLSEHLAVIQSQPGIVHNDTVCRSMVWYAWASGHMDEAGRDCLLAFLADPSIG